MNRLSQNGFDWNLHFFITFLKPHTINITKTKNNMAEKKKSKKSSSKNVKAISNKLAAFASLRVEDLDENVLQQK